MTGRRGSAQLKLFGEQAGPPKPRIRRAHVSDAGEGMENFPFGAEFLCAWCGWRSGWLCFDNRTEIRRGIPCPECIAGRREGT
ncbi:MAG: hypothetical protein AAF441_11635 [Pseudomonadota bacterium]